ncbi:MAG: 1-deoxy-D-xylulose-5-phosphate synthase [Defluviitaleaceae bacterium]|nr:1-deoxy-D-xylulose-5-phosphate synthase [Defluviitaleaceae bacterium]
MRYLDKINCPADLKGLRIPQMNALAGEMRDFLVQSVSKTGGHLASNLGVVDIAIALHYCLNSPVDKIVWDVGHQCYPHKILTGRRDRFDTLRQFGGLSGFIKSSESEHDAFDVGHSSTSLSVAHGMAVARDLLGQNHRVAAVIGDGAITSGLALEAMNNIGRSNSDLLVVLNDNNMSISENVGALSSYLGGIRTSPSYIGAKQGVQSFLDSVPTIGKVTESFLVKTKTRLKYLMQAGVLFEELGFKYYGPIDGHNLAQIIEVLQNIGQVKGPVLLHVVTKKGKGYAPAERESHKFHGVEPFHVKTGKPINTDKKTTFTDVFGKKMVEIGERDERVVAITAAMPTGTGLSGFAKEFPKRFFDVAIAESHAVTFAAAMAKSGLRPVVAIYSTFLQRAYDQIIHDVCLQNLPVIFALDRAGVVPGDGETHQGIFDISYLSHMPNMTVLAPRNGAELSEMLDFALGLGTPVAIRYSKEVDSNVYSDTLALTELGKWEILEQGAELAILALGSMVDKGQEVVEILKEHGISATLINPRFANRFDIEMLASLSDYKHIFTMEENVLSGGFGQGLASALACSGIITPKIHHFTITNDFPPQGTRQEIFGLLGLDAESIVRRIQEICNE